MRKCRIPFACPSDFCCFLLNADFSVEDNITASDDITGVSCDSGLDPAILSLSVPLISLRQAKQEELTAYQIKCINLLSRHTQYRFDCHTFFGIFCGLVDLIEGIERDQAIEGELSLSV